MKKKEYTLFLLLFSLLLVVLIRSDKVSAEEIEVTGENFEQYFDITKQEAGVASSTSIKHIGNLVEATLTEDKTTQVGSFYLKEKISVEDSFVLDGSVFLGTRADNNGGGDGIGFAFHPGEIGEIGFAGAGMGVAGLKNAHGFRLDTCYNWAVPPAPGTGGISEIGYPADWPGMLDGRYGSPFGGFLTTNGTNGYATYDTDSNKFLTLEGYKVLTPDAGYIPIQFEYKGGSPRGTLTITLGDPKGEEVKCDVIEKGLGKAPVLEYTGNKIEWEQEIESSEPLAFHIAGSTGRLHNKQSFLFEKFTFEPDKSVTIKDIWDDAGNEDERPEERVPFTLYRQIEGGEKEVVEDYIGEETKTPNGEPIYKIDKLLKRNEAGHEYFYSVEQDDVTNYTTATSQEGSGTWIFTHTLNRCIELETVPDLLSWTDSELPQIGEVINRDTGNMMRISVKDTRAGEESWNVSASVQKTEGNENFSLFSLMWKNDIGEIVDLDGQSVLSNKTVGEYKGSHYWKDWPNDTGVLLRSDSNLKLTEYNDKLKIRWTLNDTVDVE